MDTGHDILRKLHDAVRGNRYEALFRVPCELHSDTADNHGGSALNDNDRAQKHKTHRYLEDIRGITEAFR